VIKCIKTFNEKKLQQVKLIEKIVKNEFNLCCKGGDPRIYENSIFPAYVPEKNKIITPCIM